MPIRRETIEEEVKLGFYEDYTIRVATPLDGNRYSISTTDGTGFDTRDCGGVVPRPGDIIRIYGGCGFPIHGMALNGQLLFWLTPAEREAERREMLANMKREREERFELSKDRLDQRYDSLPDPLKRRIARFRQEDPKFRVESEDYEMFCCAQAAIMADWARQFTYPEAELRRWARLDYREQVAAMPGFSDDHSGNTFGGSVGLAIALLNNKAV